LLEFLGFPALPLALAGLAAAVFTSAIILFCFFCLKFAG
jgi:hypothetical protein